MAISTTSATGSLWLDGPAPTPAAPLRGPTRADVAIVGGGIAGITLATLLAREDADVCVLEAATVASGVTGNTSAKVSALQGTRLQQIRGAHGDEAVRVYAEASRSAVEDVAQLAADHRIDCALERRPAVTYAATPADRATVEAEHEAALAAGLPVRLSDDDAGLPFPVGGAVWLDEQVQFQPVDYVRGLARVAQAAGARIYEGSRALSLSGGRPATVRTADGEVVCEQVVVASHFPVFDRGLAFARQVAQRSYAIAVRAPTATTRVMALSAGGTTRSIRPFGEMLVVGGEGHPTGSRDATAERFAALEAFARSNWDVEGAVTHRWSSQDPVPYDELPLIGPLVPRSTHLWMATGWAKWGLTGATMAARILAARVQGRDHPWGERFTPTRLSLRSMPSLASDGARYPGHLLGDRLRPGRGDVASIAPGEGAIVRDGLGRTAVYRDDDGALHAVAARCTHLGCLVRFNAAERSWDCPCHGGRFDVDGDVLEGPPTHPLERRRLEG